MVGSTPSLLRVLGGIKTALPPFPFSISDIMMTALKWRGRDKNSPENIKIRRSNETANQRVSLWERGGGMVEQLAIRIYYLTTGLISDSYPAPSLFKEMSAWSNTAGGDELAKFRFGLLPLFLPYFPPNLIRSSVKCRMYLSTRTTSHVWWGTGRKPLSKISNFKQLRLFVLSQLSTSRTMPNETNAWNF